MEKHSFQPRKAVALFFLQKLAIWWESITRELWKRLPKWKLDETPSLIPFPVRIPGGTDVANRPDP